MRRYPDPSDLSDPDDWQPATSRPGELFTIEGRIGAARAFARGVRNTDPRTKAYRRSMQRMALLFVGMAIAAGALVGVLVAAF